MDIKTKKKLTKLHRKMWKAIAGYKPGNVEEIKSTVLLDEKLGLQKAYAKLNTGRKLPRHHCFMCELWYGNTAHFFAINCVDCPFQQYAICIPSNIACLDPKSPYSKLQDTTDPKEWKKLCKDIQDMASS